MLGRIKRLCATDSEGKRKKYERSDKNQRRTIKEVIRSSGEEEYWREDSEGNGGEEEAGEEENEVEGEKKNR